MKKYFREIIILLLCSSSVLIFNSCAEQLNETDKSSTSIQFKIENGNNNFLGKGWWEPENFEESNKSSLPYNSFLKTSQSFDDVKILCLDMTKWESFEKFYDAWQSDMQEGLFDTSLWNESRDLWTNVSMILRSYTGDYYEFVGEVNLHIENNIAKGTVNLNPGLNYFLYAFRKEGETISIGETVTMIKEGEKNTVRISYGSMNFPPEVPSSPHPPDGATGVRLDVTLNWQCSDPEGDTLNYYVYFGTSSDPSWVNYQSQNSYNPGTLLPETKYYWKIEAYDKDYNSSESPVWSFTTGR